MLPKLFPHSLHEPSRRLLLATAALLAPSAAPALAAPVPMCPLATEDAGPEIERLFTDSTGRELRFRTVLPDDFDPAQAYGVLIYFHGNNDSAGGTFFPQVQYFAEMAEPRGLIPVVVRAPQTLDPGSTTLAWFSQDQVLVREWLQQDLGGCLKLDRSKVFFMGGSAGTNFLNHALQEWMARDDLAGGVLGMCGEWFSRGGYLATPIARVRDRFKVFIEATTEDFLYQSSLAGYDYLRYDLGVQVRADLSRAGAHCEDSDVNAGRALDWMLGRQEWPEDPPAEVHWRRTYFGPAHGAHSIVARSDETYVAVRDLAIQSPEERSAAEAAYYAGGDEYIGYTNWLMDHQPHVLGFSTVLTSEDAIHWDALAVVSPRVMDLAEDANGELIFATEMGIARLNGTDLEVVAMDGQVAIAIELLSDGSLLLATVDSVFKSTDGETWTDLGLDVSDYPFGYALSGVSAGQIQEHAGKIYVAWNDQLFVSDNDGASWSTTSLPPDTASFAVSDDGIFAATWESQPRHLFRSINGGVDYEQVSTRDDITGIFALPGGELLMTGYMTASRSTDGGDSWVTVPGLTAIEWPVMASHSAERNALVDQRGIYRLNADGKVGDDSTSGEAELSADGGTQDPDAGGTEIEPDAGATNPGGAAGASGASGSSGASGASDPNADPDAGPVAGADAGALSPQSATDVQDAGCGCRAIGQPRDDRRTQRTGLSIVLGLALTSLLGRTRRRRAINT